MSKRIIPAVLLMVLMFAGAAYSDVASPCGFSENRRRITPNRAARFTLLPAKNKANTLEFVIDADFSGVCSYTFSQVSGDIKEAVSTAEISCDEGKSRRYISFENPEAGQERRYELRAEFNP